MNASQAIRRDVKRTIQRKAVEYVKCLADLVQEEQNGVGECGSLMGICHALRTERLEEGIEWGRRRAESLFAEVEQCCLDAVAEYFSAEAAGKLYELQLAQGNGSDQQKMAKPVVAENLNGKLKAAHRNGKAAKSDFAPNGAMGSESPTSNSLVAFLKSDPSFCRVHPEHRHKRVFKHTAGGHVFVPRNGENKKSCWRALRHISELKGVLHVVCEGRVQAQNGTACGV